MIDRLCFHRVTQNVLMPLSKEDAEFSPILVLPNLHLELSGLGLVCKRPWPGMTRGLFKAEDRFIETYFSTFPGIWRHGDLAMREKDGTWYIFGRSDDVIKVAGRRVGPSEVENVVADVDGVVESAAIGAPDPMKGEAVIVFVVKQKNVAPEDLKTRILFAVQKGFGKPFTPREVYFISELPKTRNAKVLRRVIRQAYMGEVGNLPSSLVNPDVVKEIRQRVQDGDQDK